MPGTAGQQPLRAAPVNVLDDPFKGITECQVHQPGMDDDCPDCISEFQTKQAVLGDIMEMAQAAEKDLAAMGLRVPVQVMYELRLELLIESILQDRNRVHFEVEVGRRYCEQLDAAKAEAKKAKNRLQVVTDIPSFLKRKP